MVMGNHGIPTKPVGGLLSNIGKVCFLPLFFFFLLEGKPHCYQSKDFKLKGGKWSPSPQ